jgi:hypothetical protein
MRLAFAVLPFEEYFASKAIDGLLAGIWAILAGVVPLFPVIMNPPPMYCRSTVSTR